jgi:hypothetical protein
VMMVRDGKIGVRISDEYWVESEIEIDHGDGWRVVGYVYDGNIQEFRFVFGQGLRGLVTDAVKSVDFGESKHALIGGRYDKGSELVVDRFHGILYTIWMYDEVLVVDDIRRILILTLDKDILGSNYYGIFKLLEEKNVFGNIINNVSMISINE